MEISKIDHGSYNTTCITANVTLGLNDWNIVEIIDTKYDYGKELVKLSKEKSKEMKTYETELNEYLLENGFDKVIWLYDKRIYATKAKSTSRDWLKQIRLKGVFI